MLKQFLLSLCVTVLSANAFAMSGQELAQKVYDRDDGDDAYFKTEMVLVDRNQKERRRTMESYVADADGLLKTFAEFLDPADIRGTRFLSWENADEDDTQYLYLPELGRARRIVSSQKRLQFVNTDFTYEDMQRRKPDEDIHRIIREDVYCGYPVYVLESIPKKDTSQYSKRISFIEKKSLVAVVIDFFDKNGEVVKNFRIFDLRLIDGIWTVMHMGMRDLKAGHRTEMFIREVKYNTGIPAGIFDVRNLERKK